MIPQIKKTPKAYALEALYFTGGAGGGRCQIKIGLLQFTGPLHRQIVLIDVRSLDQCA